MVEESNYATHVRQKDDKHLIRHFSAVLLLVARYKHYLTINVIVITDLVRFHKPKPKPSKLECCSSSRMYCTCVHGTRLQIRHRGGSTGPHSNEHGSARMGADMYEGREEPKRWRLHMSNASPEILIDTVSPGRELIS